MKIADTTSCPASDGLPEGWAIAPIRDFTSKVGSGATPRGGSESYKDRGTPLIRSMNVRLDGFRKEGLAFLDAAQAEALQEVTVLAGDVLLNITGASIGRVTQAPAEMAGARVNQHVCIIRPVPLIDAGYLSRYLSSPTVQEKILGEEYGVTRQALTKGGILAFEVPIAPLAEQKRIVAQVEVLLARVNAARERLAKAPAILKRFRQSVLAAACSGQLTAGWRDASPCDERGSDLLAVLRRQHASAGTATNRGRRGANSARYASEDNGGQNGLDLELMPELPESWCYARADEVVEPGTVVTYGIVLPGPQVSGGVRYVRGLDIENGRVLVDQLWRTSAEIADRHERSRLEPGDVLLCVIRHLKVAIVPNGLSGANLTQGTVRLRPSKAMLGRYLAACLDSPYAQAWMKSRYFGMDMPRINVEDARAIPVPLPPLAEEREIVRRVEALFALADKIEARVQAAAARVEKITQAILAKAFRGELVPTEAELARAEGRDYEPASVLLERIRAERAAGQAPKAGGRVRREGAGVPPRAAEAGQRKLPRGIFFKRGAIAAYVVDRLHAKRTFGRVQLEKVLYLTEALIGVDLAGHYTRRAAGPLDPDVYGIESLAAKQRWFTATGGAKRGIRYWPGPRIADRCGAARTILGDRLGEMDRLLGAIAIMTTEQAEIFATVFAAWNDFLIDHREPTDAEIITQVRENWHEAKQRFSAKQLQKCISWLREKGWVPRGIGGKC